MSRAQVLHVEVGGTYGGSLRALELYLKYREPQSSAHDLLLYYPTPGAERLGPLVRSLYFLYDRAPNFAQQSGPRVHSARSLSRAAQSTGPRLRGLREWVHFGLAAPTAFRLWRFLGQHKYDVIHVNNTFTYQPATVFAADWRGVPLVSHVRNPVVRTSLSKRLLVKSHCVAVVNTPTADSLTAWRTGARIETCYDGLEPPRPDLDAVFRLRASLASGNEILIGALGRLAEQKGFHILLRAAPEVLRQEPKARFVVAGDGPLRPDLENAARALGMFDRFNFVGFRPDPENFTAALDIFVSSSLWEGMPLSIAEAMLLRKPVVATKIPGVSELLGWQGAEQLAPPNDSEALAACILKVIRGSHSRNNAALEAAASRASAMLDPGRSARHLDSLIQFAFGRPSEPQAGGLVQGLSLSGRELEDGAAGGRQGRASCRGDVPTRGLHRHKPESAESGVGTVLQQARDRRAVNQVRETGGEDDAANEVRSSPGSAGVAVEVRHFQQGVFSEF